MIKRTLQRAATIVVFFGFMPVVAWIGIGTPGVSAGTRYQIVEIVIIGFACLAALCVLAFWIAAFRKVWNLIGSGKDGA